MVSAAELRSSLAVGGSRGLRMLWDDLGSFPGAVGRRKYGTEESRELFHGGSRLGGRKWENVLF